MTPEIAIRLFSLLGAVGLSVWFFYGPWQKLITDVVRQNLFEVRDYVMVYSYDNGVDLDSDEYQTVRNQFNLLIRFAHEMRLSRLIAHAASGAAKHQEHPVINPIDKIHNEKVREALLKKWNEAIGYIVIMIWLRSPIVMMLTMILLPLIFVEHLLNKKFYPAVNEGVKILVNKEFESERVSLRLTEQHA